MEIEWLVSALESHTRQFQKMSWSMMPFRSERQRRFLWARHPKIAKKWSRYPFGLKKEHRARTTAMSDRVAENLLAKEERES